MRRPQGSVALNNESDVACKLKYGRSSRSVRGPISLQVQQLVRGEAPSYVSYEHLYNPSHTFKGPVD